MIRSSPIDATWIPTFDYTNPSSVDIADYRAWFKGNGHHIPGNLTDCDLEKEMQKVSRGITNKTKTSPLYEFHSF